VTDEKSDPSDFEREPDLIPATEATGPDSGFSWSLAVFLLIGLGFVVFAVQNTDDVDLKFLSFEFRIALPLLIVITALIAVIADEFVGLVRRRRRRRRMAEKEELKRYRGK
jgi:uncharacterized integral membrane protein